MRSKEGAKKERLKSAVKTLIIQEFRVLKLGQVFTPDFIMDEMDRSVQEAKRQVVALVRLMPYKERNTLLKKVIRQSVDEEIDLAIQARKNRCLRCIYGRFYDESGKAYIDLPVGINIIQTIGCNKLRPSARKSCRRFVESQRATSLENYLNEMTLFYEVKEMFVRFNEIWEDYLLH